MSVIMSVLEILVWLAIGIASLVYSVYHEEWPEAVMASVMVLFALMVLFLNLFVKKKNEEGP